MIYYFFNNLTLGESVANIIFFNNIKDFLVHNCIHIYYYCQAIYLDTIREFVTSGNLFVFSIDQKPTHSFELSAENTKIGETLKQVRERNNNRVCLDLFYKVLFNNVLRKHNIPLKFNSFYYSDHDLTSRYENLNGKYKELDILVVCSNKKDDWISHLQLLDANYRIATTFKINDAILSTTDEALSLKTVTAIATKVPIIIVLDSDFYFCLLNDQTLKNAKQIILLNDTVEFSFPNFAQKKKLDDITLDYLKPFIPNLTPKKVTTKPADKDNDIQKVIEKEDELKKKYKNFDWIHYIYFNPDLTNIHGQPATELTAWRHFVNYGIQERRIYSFDWVKYISDNNLQDIAHNKDEAFTHLKRNNNRDLYIRQASFSDEDENYKLKLFDWQFYVTNHKDLHNINNYEDALNHYIEHGQKEGRPICDFNWMDYLMLNRDLIDCGIINEIKATKHWALHGKLEGRKYKK